ncbi:MAG: protein kinase [Chloroflexi bacterium]|uniref:protein kinase domain-containing protein n=1 Tax=Candidatus Flexifilum breve TaxID=3140694 RepID=UPI003136AF31|nr:protein kinase [Chloroflexota bacterium]
MATRKLGKYEIIERLGRGGMAEVYRAYHASLDRFVAIKVLHAFLADDPEFKERFEKEAKHIARLKHANIVQVYDFENDPDNESYYMVMELIQGPTLKDVLTDLQTRHELMPLKEALRVVREAASALAYAHSQNMIHRDVKPANLMLDSDSRIVLTDFGIAKIVTGIQFTASGGMVGTPAYMAPEQGLGEAGDERSDLYSLGVIMYQLVTGNLPFEGDTPIAVILRHVNDPVPSARVSNPSLPESVDKIIQRLLAKDPDERYQSATDLIADLEKVERGQVVSFDQVVKVDRPHRPVPAEYDTLDLSPRDRSTMRRSSIDLSRPNDMVMAPEPRERQRRPSWPLWLLLVAVIGIGGGAFALVPRDDGRSWLAALIATSTPSSTPTATSTPTETLPPTATFTPSLTPTETPTSTFTATLTPTETFTPSNTPTFTYTPTPTPTSSLTPSNTPTETFTPSNTPTSTYTPSNTPTSTFTASFTPTPTPSNTPSITPTPTIDLTMTLIMATQFYEFQTATIAACDFDYAISDQQPPDDDFFRADQPYVRQITFVNTGTCPWERNTSLTYVSGEDFNLVDRIFVRERVNVGEDVTLTFSGRTPRTGATYSGVFELRTPGQILIGQPLTITVQVFEGQ